MVAVKTTRRQDAIDLARNSPDAFIELVLGYTQAPIHREIQQHLTDSDNPSVTTHRGAGKTDQVSIGRTAWEIGRNPDIRVKCVKNVDTEAAKITDATRRIIDSPKFREVFPNCIPDRNHWTGQSFRVQRQAVGEKEPTYQAYGVLSTATGGRADLLIYDDICDAKNTIQEPAKRESVRVAYQNTFQPMLVKGGRCWRVYTPYHIADITADWEKNPHIQTLSRPVLNFRSPWPEEFPADRLHLILEDIGPIAFARAYELKRITDQDILVRREWLQESLYIDEIPDTVGGRWVGSIDLAYAKKRLGGIRLPGHDPDYNVALRAWVDDYGNIFVHRMLRIRTTWPEFKSMLIQFLADCEMIAALDVGAERALIQELNHETSLNVRAISLTEKDAGEASGGIDKKARLARETAAIESGKFRLRGTMRSGEAVVVAELEPLYDELITFPACDHDDCVDAASQLLKIVRKRYVRRSGKERQKQSRAELHKKRSSVDSWYPT